MLLKIFQSINLTAQDDKKEDIEMNKLKFFLSFELNLGFYYVTTLVIAHKLWAISSDIPPEV